jgi:hypothetical protein
MHGFIMVKFKDFNQQNINKNLEIQGMQYGIDQQQRVGKFKMPDGKTYTIEILNITQEQAGQLNETDWEIIALRVALILKDKHLLPEKEITIKKNVVTLSENRTITHTDTGNRMLDTSQHANALFHHLSTKFSSVQPPVLNNRENVYEIEKKISPQEKKKLDLVLLDPKTERFDLTSLLKKINEREEGQIFIQFTSTDSNKHPLEFIIDPKKFDFSTINTLLEEQLQSRIKEGYSNLNIYGFTKTPSDTPLLISDIWSIKYDKTQNSVIITQETLPKSIKQNYTVKKLTIEKPITIKNETQKKDTKDKDIIPIFITIDDMTEKFLTQQPLNKTTPIPPNEITPNPKETPKPHNVTVINEGRGYFINSFGELIY